ncbi:hypothetical protein LSCM4_07892 [Leishmania orientalis]|uniref:Calcium uniporter protein C-terminal domain-containing protein n=1 Tax=Leishmania orientalis TaxID=2249476 RepID=A0A836KRM2_9TRYP|nr:hypothetical protein LSCM4_07892 [Leishmania orientalis]
MMRLTCCGAAAHCTRRHLLFRLPTTPSALRSHSTAAADAAAKAKLTSPGAPLNHVFKLVSKSDAASPSFVSRSVVVVHTSYAALPAAEGAHNFSRRLDAEAGEGSIATVHPSAAPSYTVTDVAAFEQLISEAVRLYPATLEAAATASAVPAPSPSPVPATPARQASARRAPTALISDHTVRELQILLAEAERALAPSTARKEKIDGFVYGVYLPLLKYGAFALLAVHFVVYFRWIFFVFDWNLAEPTTYFLSYTGVFCSLVYHYYRCGEDEFTWKNIFEHLASRKAEKTYAKEKLDVVDMAQLQRRIALIKQELAHMSLSR